MCMCLCVYVFVYVYMYVCLCVSVLNDKINEEKNEKNKNEYKKRRQILLQSAKKQIDFRSKSIIFKEPPPQQFLEGMYSTLSHDQEYNEIAQVNKGSRGENKGETIVFRRYPSLLICSARDDTQKKRWGETHSRFEIVSPNVSKKKYAEGMDLVFSKRGLPNFLYPFLFFSFFSSFILSFRKSNSCCIGSYF